MDAFHLKKLASELRLLIYPYMDLQLQHDLNAPAVVLAFAADPDLHAEIQPVYKSCNLVLHLKDQDAFKKMKMKELLKVRHLRISYEVPADLPQGIENDEELGTTTHWIHFRANKCRLLNAFETLTFDLSAARVWKSCHMEGTSWQHLTENVMRASKTGVRKLVVKSGPRTPLAVRGGVSSRMVAPGIAMWINLKVTEDGRVKDVWTLESRSGVALPLIRVDKIRATRNIGPVPERYMEAVPVRR